MAVANEAEPQSVIGASGQEYISIKVPDPHLGMRDKLLTREEYVRMLNDRGGGAIEQEEQIVS